MPYEMNRSGVRHDLKRMMSLAGSTGACEVMEKGTKLFEKEEKHACKIVVKRLECMYRRIGICVQKIDAR